MAGFPGFAKRYKAVIYFLLSVFLVFVLNGFFLHILSESLKRHIIRTVKHNAVRVDGLKVTLAPLTWRGIREGYLQNIYISAAYYEKKNLAIEDIKIKSSRMVFSWSSWFKTRRLEITRLEDAFLTATVTEKAMNQFRKTEYPEHNLRIIINPAALALVYNLDLLVKKVEIVYEGVPKITGPDKFSIYPRRLLISDLSIPSAYLQSYQNRLRLNVPADLPLPVGLKEVKLLKGKIRLVWQEEKGG